MSLDLLHTRDNIFDSDDNSLVSFKDCPNRCINGYILDPYSHSKRECPYCADMRKKAVKEKLKNKTSGKTVEEILNLPKSFSGLAYDIDSVIPESAKKDLIQESYVTVINELKALAKTIKGGILPDHSYLFNLGKKVYEGNYIYYIISNAYVSGFSTSPLLSAYDIVNLRLLAEKGLSDTELGVSYNDILKKDLVVVDIEAGATNNSILAVKGLMQLRAFRSLPTIIFTNQWGSVIQDLCDNQSSFSLASLYSVEYKEKAKEKMANKKSLVTSDTASLTTEQFKSLFGTS